MPQHNLEERIGWIEARIDVLVLEIRHIHDIIKELRKDLPTITEDRQSVSSFNRPEKKLRS